MTHQDLSLAALHLEVSPYTPHTSRLTSKNNDEKEQKDQYVSRHIRKHDMNYKAITIQSLDMRRAKKREHVTCTSNQYTEYII